MPPKKRSPTKKTKEILIEEPEESKEDLSPAPFHIEIYEYFSKKEFSDEDLDLWFDFYEQKTKYAVLELLSTVVIIAGFDFHLTVQHIRESTRDEIFSEINALIDTSTAIPPIVEQMEGTNQLVSQFWSNFFHKFFIRKFHTKAEFEIFRDWTFTFSDSDNRTLRISATFCLLICLESLSSFLSKGKNILYSKLFTQILSSVIKYRIRDIDVDLRNLIIQKVSLTIQVSPSEYEANNFVHYLTDSLFDESSKNRKEALKECFKSIKS